MSFNQAHRCVLLIFIIVASTALTARAFLSSVSNFSVAHNLTFNIRSQAGVIGWPYFSIHGSDDIFWLYFQVLGAESTFVETEFQVSYPDVMIPLFGASSQALCQSVAQVGDTRAFPCAFYGFHRNGTRPNWLGFVSNAKNESNIIFVNRSLPFACSSELPCDVRTPDPADGEVGGCSGSEAVTSDTLVIVIWNNTRYLYRPLLYFAGVGTVNIVPVTWPSGMANHDASLFFGPIPTAAATALCALNLVHLNGTVEVYSVDVVDPRNQIGLRRIATVVPVPATQQLCVPNAQYIQSADVCQGAMLSITCRSGEGWLWELRTNGIFGLVGHFTMAPPNTLSKGPLIVDFGMIQNAAGLCAPALLTYVALVGRGMYEPVSSIAPPLSEGTLVLSLATFTGNMTVNDETGAYTYWLTHWQHASSVSGGVFSISSSNQSLRHGIGWVSPPQYPASVTTCDIDADCESVVGQSTLWLLASAFYGAVTSDYNILIDPSNGSLATPSPRLHTEDQTLVGGATFSGPTFLGSEPKTFTRISYSNIGTSALLQEPANGGRPTLQLRSNFENRGSMNVDMEEILCNVSWFWQASYDESTRYLPSPVSLRYVLPLWPSNLGIQWVQDTPLITATDSWTSTAALLLGASSTDIPITLGTSYPINSSIASVNTDYSPYLFVCHGNTISAYNTNVGNLIWTFDQLSARPLCRSGTCGCGEYSSVLLSSDNVYLIVVFQDFLIESSGIVVLDSGTGYAEMNISTEPSNNGLILNECGIFGYFGDLVDITPAIDTVMFAFPIVDTRCILAILLNPELAQFQWGLFVLTGESLYFSNVATLQGQILLLSEPPTLVGGPNYGYGGRICAFEVAVLQEAMSSNPSSTLFGVNPFYIIPGAVSYIAVNELIVVVEFINITTPHENEGKFFIQFHVYRGSSGILMWLTNFYSIPDFQKDNVPLEMLELFTTVQAEVAAVVTWACVGAGQLLCIVVAPDFSEPLQFPWTNRCFGPPAASINRFLIWATEGYEAFSVPVNEGALGWVGLVGYVYEPFEVNQTSCSDALVANDGLLMRCALIGSTEKHLYIVDAKTGIILYGCGPKVGPTSFAMSLDGSYITYTDEDLMSVVTLVLRTRVEMSQVPINATVCASDAVAHYVLSIQKEIVIATLAPIDVSLAIAVTNSTSDYYIEESFAFYSSMNNPLSFDALASFFAPDLVALPTIYPLLANLLGQGPVYIANLDPSYITSSHGTTRVMEATQCRDCSLSCPFFCSLDMVTGDQYKYTSRTQSIDSVVKPYGFIEFSLNASSRKIPYTGDVILNLQRAQFELPYTQQPIQCVALPEYVTTTAPSGRYCLMTSAWSVIELVDGGASYISTYLPWPTSIGEVPSYYGYSVWTPTPVLMAGNEVGLANFLSKYPKALPQSITRQSTVVNVSFVNENTISVQMHGGELFYSATTCGNTTEILEDLPMCRSTYLNFSNGIVNDEIATVTWEGLQGSNWGVGFVAVGYRVRLPEVLRELQTGVAVTCGAEQNSNPLCTTGCQPTASCVSQKYSTFSLYLSVQSWLPKGSALATTGQCDGKGAVLAADPSPPAAMPEEFDVKFYGTKEGTVVLTIDLDGSEVVMYSSDQLDPVIYGVRFSFSRCTFYTLSNVVAQPFGWLAICAVKSLLLTFAFYLMEHRVRGRERERDAIKDRMARLVAEIEDIHKAEANIDPVQDELMLPSEPSSDAIQSVERHSSFGLRRRHSALRDNAELEALEVQLGRCSEEEQRLASCGKTQNIIDRFTKIVTTLAGFRHTKEQAHQSREVRGNMLPKDLDEAGLVELLLFVLKEDRRHSPMVKAFATYYELAMCNNRCWIVRQLPVAHCGSHRVSAIHEAQLSAVHAALREAYKCYKCIRLDSPEAALPRPTSQSPLLHAGPATAYSKPYFTEDEIETAGSEFTRLVAAFNGMHTTHPACFEHAILSFRRADAQLQPSTILLTLSVMQSIATVFIYTIDVYIRTWTTKLTVLQMYEVICFMIFNSSLPSSLLVNAILHADLGPGMQATTVFGWIKYVARRPFVLVTFFLLAPPFVTHVIPGLFLYCWLLVPPMAIVIFLEAYLRRRSTRRRSKRLVAARVFCRVAILFTTAIVFSVSFNAADGYIWKWAREERFTTGSYTAKEYISAIEQDYNSRSLACVWEHLFATISNFLQMGFLLV